MRHTLFPLAPLFASFGLLIVGHGLLGMLIPIRMSLVHFSTQSIGIVAACYSIGFIVGTRIVGRAIRNVQHIRTYAALAAIAASIALAFALFTNPVFWAVIRLLYGCAVAGLFMVTESWLNANTPRHHRGKVLGAYGIVNYLGFGGGQFLLLAADIHTTRLFLLAAILICMSLTPLALARASSPELPDIRPTRLRDLYRLHHGGLSGALGSGIIIGSFLGLGPVFAKGSGFTNSEIAVFMGLTISAGFLLQWPIGAISDRYSRDAVIPIVSLGVAALSLAIVLLTGYSFAVITGLAIVWGALSFTLYPVSVALVNDYVDSSEFVQASASLLLVYSLGMIAGNLIAGPIMDMMGSGGLFGVATVTAVVLAVYTDMHRRRVPPPRAEDLSPYQILPRNSPYASALDPRSDTGTQLEFDFEANADGSEG